MPKILQLSTHVANLIAAGEVVERPASVAKELLENAVDAGATKITIEIRDGGMTFLRVTDNGCGMAPQDARTAFLRHATSKLRNEEDLASIATMGFRGEALAAIASVSRIDLLTKTPGNLSGTSLHLEAGVITEETESGCPDGTTILVRDLFYNTPARMKFMKSDTVEAGRVALAVQMQALAHPEVAFTFLRDGKQLLSTPGSGDLGAAVYCVYGREAAKMAQVESKWDACTLRGFVSKPTDARPSRSMQTFFVNGRPVKSKILTAALEEAYRNQLMVGKFPACVLHLNVPVNAVDVNVHPAKTEVKFLSEKTVFDCVHYGVLGALNKTPDRPQVQFKPNTGPLQTSPQTGVVTEGNARGAISQGKPDIVGGLSKAPAPTSLPKSESAKKEPFYRTMTAQEYKAFTGALQEAPQPKAAAAAATLAKVERGQHMPLREPVVLPVTEAPKPEPVQMELPLPEAAPWRLVGELYNTYILVEQGEDAFLIDKHAAHERILFEKLKAHQEAISSQLLLTPIPVRMRPDGAAELINNGALLTGLGFEIEEFGDDTVLLRQIPMDLSPDDAADAVQTLAADLLVGRREKADTVRDTLLHTVACKAAIKAGWKNDEKELLAVAKAVMEREDLKYCPHGRPICVSLSKKQLEKQFKRA